LQAFFIGGKYMRMYAGMSRKGTRLVSPRKKAESKGEWKRITIGIYDSQTKFLDHLGFAIKRNNGKAFERSAIIQSLIDALELSGLNLDSVKTKEDMVEILTKALKQATPGKGTK
jgi:hypothetical protein